MTKDIKLLKEKKIKKYQKCLVGYKNYLKKRFKTKNQEKKRLERELKFIDDSPSFYGGGLEKWKGKRLEKCVKKYANALDKEEQELKQRLLRIRVEKSNLKRQIKEALN